MLAITTIEGAVCQELFRFLHSWNSRKLGSVFERVTRILTFSSMIAATRLVVSIFAGLVFVPTLPLIAAGEHPSAPQQPQMQQLPQGTTTSQQSSAQTMQASNADISAGRKKYIDSSATKSADRKFHVRHSGKDLPLELIKVH